MLGKEVKANLGSEGNYFGIKVPHFSFTRLRTVDPVLRVEMSSTGEVACFGNTLYEAYYKAILSTGVEISKKAVLLSLGGEEAKARLLQAARLLSENKYQIFATDRTWQFLNRYGLKAKFVYKVYEKKTPSVLEIVNKRQVGFVVNLSDRSDLGVKELKKETSDGYLIRRAAVDANIPLFTKGSIANLFIRSIIKYDQKDLLILPWDYYLRKP